MKTLHIMRSEPDAMVRLFIVEASKNNQIIEFPLYHQPVDYNRLVKEIFDKDRVYCWW
jgi:hypothetical protein